MLDVDTFLTALYVIVDDLCQSQASEQRRPGPPASLSESEVLTLAIFASAGLRARGTSTALSQQQPQRCFPHPARALAGQPLRTRSQAALVEELCT
jgi:hypothetical protein